MVGGKLSYGVTSYGSGWRKAVVWRNQLWQRLGGRLSYGVTSYGSSWRKAVLNRCLDFVVLDWCMVKSETGMLVLHINGNLFLEISTETTCSGS